jgi:hypothetical protein
MNAKIATPSVHHYDTRLHLVLCGLGGFELRSTKHSRSVTCPVCRGLLGERPTIASSTGAAAPASIPAG